MSSRLALSQPFHADGILEFLGTRAIAGVEHVEGRTYAGVLHLPHGHGVVELTLHDDHVACELELDDERDAPVAVAGSRRLLDLDADPIAIADVLGADPLLAPMLAAAPGLRLPSQFDGFEVAARAIVGQQVSVAGARTILGRFAQTYGTSVSFGLAASHGLTHAFATAAAMAEAEDTALSMPRARARALIGVAQAVADGKLELDPASDRAAVREALLALPGIGPWTADYISMRALANPDVMLETDLIIRRVLDHHGVTPEQTERWKPWRSYAAMHLWRASTDLERTP